MEQNSTPNKRTRMYMRRRVVRAARNHHQPEQLKLNMEIKEDALSAAVLEVLDKDNYVAWSVRVRTYLMAQDLWDVVEATTKPPKKEDDEAAFKVWSNKNSMALHVLQVSCGPHTLSVIRQISSAKIAWNTLAVVLQVLKEDNYVDWSVRVKNYLMAYDLWDIIEATTEPPRQEDDEIAFKAWRKKNSMALHVIQISCVSDTFSEIIEISSAKIAWDTLAVKFLQGPEEENYVDWSIRVKTYLMAHDLWEIIEATTEPPKQEDDETAFKAWTMKNSMALHVIQISCRPDVFSEVIQISSAKNAWDTLVEKYNVPTDTNSGSSENGNVDYVQYEALIEAVQSGDWNATEDFLTHHPGAAGAKITNLGETVLHVACKARHEDIVDKLMDVMSEEHSAIPNCYGDTALVNAINFGDERMAACMARKNNNLLRIKNPALGIPVNQAICDGRIELARYLYSLTSLEDLTPEKGNHGATLCTQAIYNRSLDIALDLIQHCPRLTLALDGNGCSPLYVLASMPNAYWSGDRLVFWKRWIYSCMHVQSAHATKEIRLNIQNVEKSRSDQVKIIGSGIKDLYETKLVHVQSHELLDCMCKEVSISRSSSFIEQAIFRSIERGNAEFIFGIIRANPTLMWSRGENGMSIFTSAILHRQAKIFSLIYGLAVKNRMTTWVDNKGNCILHMAGMAGDFIQLKQIQCATSQMRTELQWFKEVESIVPPRLKEYLNKDGLTPRELFMKNHKDLMKEGETWMKDTANSCTVVGTLIVTIMFAAAFTVPGGNKQDGFPVFLDEKLFMLFIISDALSLFLSSTSVLMFLGILTSRYAEDDFFESLPRKLIIGHCTLFFSILTMMMAFSSALLIMLQEQSWIVIPIVCLASLPVTLFVMLQFPLVAEMFILTYGPGISDKKIGRWV